MACLDRERTPVSQNGLFVSAEAARRAPVATLAIRACRGCGFVFNAAFRALDVPYDAAYENDQTASTVFAAHVDLVASRVLAALGEGEPAVILEVGCGQGSFLERLVTSAPSRVAAAYGFDPAWRGGPTHPRITIVPRLFDAVSAAGIPRASVVVTRHVIEHVADPIGFLSAIGRALPPGSGARLFLETPCVSWILEHRVLQDFFYEHCSYFAARTLQVALRRAGLAPIAVEHLFGGQYLLASARFDGITQPSSEQPPAEGIEQTLRAAASFAEAHREGTERWRRRIEGFQGKLAVWGAGAKGVTFVNTVDPEHAHVDCVIDINPNKQGAFVPVTAHPIVSPDVAHARGVKGIIIMNPNYRGEIEADVASRGLAFEQLVEG
jgi:SAM-dependent methyltransferase